MRRNALGTIGLSRAQSAAQRGGPLAKFSSQSAVTKQLTRQHDARRLIGPPVVQVTDQGPPLNFEPTSGFFDFTQPGIGHGALQARCWAALSASRAAGGRDSESRRVHGSSPVLISAATDAKHVPGLCTAPIEAHTAQKCGSTRLDWPKTSAFDHPYRPLESLTLLVSLSRFRSVLVSVPGFVDCPGFGRSQT